MVAGGRGPCAEGQQMTFINYIHILWVTKAEESMRAIVYYIQPPQKSKSQYFRDISESRSSREEEGGRVTDFERAKMRGNSDEGQLRMDIKIGGISVVPLLLYQAINSSRRKCVNAGRLDRLMQHSNDSHAISANR